MARHPRLPAGSVRFVNGILKQWGKVEPAIDKVDAKPTLVFSNANTTGVEFRHLRTPEACQEISPGWSAATPGVIVSLKSAPRQAC
jgi:hypothetical protein